MRSILLKLFVPALALLAAVLPMGAQSISIRTVDPVSDSLAIEKMRFKMDRIRRQRPTVALVLSGGGAKGAAHVGAIRFLEQVGIPVDMVLGTSMGGLVGGLYSMGYNPEQMDSLLRSLDWNVILSDRVPNEYVSYSQKKYREKFLFSIPFYYSAEAMFSSSGVKAKKADPDDPDDESGLLHIGANDEFAEKTLKENLFGSLPSGYISGQNVNNLISSLTVGYQDDIDFTDLPIPFFCISADMVSGRAKLWHDGKLADALRSTMSIPGMFDPVRVDGMVLVDGGIRNNYPTDVAKAMGADIVIGVELSDAQMTYSDIHNLGDMVWQIIDILGMDAFQKNISIPDVTIKPYLAGYNMLSFDPESIDIIISRGYEAARSRTDELLAIKDRVGRATVELGNDPGIDIGVQAVSVSDITFEGVTEREAEYLRRHIAISPWERLTKSDVEAAVSSIFATKSFKSVTYEMLGESEPFTLNIKCKKGPVHQLGLGGRFDSEEVLSLLLNLGFNVHKVEGMSWDLTGKIGANPYVELRNTYKGSMLPAVNLDARFSYSKMDLYKLGNSKLNLSYYNVRERLYLSDWKWKMNDFKAGIMNEYYNVNSLLSTDYIPDSYNEKMLKNDYMSLFLESRNDSMDDGYFPSRGTNFGISFRYVFAGLLEKVDPVYIAQMDFSKVIRCSDRLSFIPQIHARFNIGENVPLVFMNLAGGSIKGRYVEQQIPFMGVNFATPLDDKMVMARTDFRLQLTRNNYLTAVANFLKDSDDFSSDLLWTGGTHCGFGLEYGYDSIIGPVTFNVHWSDIQHSVGAYFSVGFNF